MSPTQRRGGSSTISRADRNRRWLRSRRRWGSSAMSRWPRAAGAWGDRGKPDHHAIGQLAAEYLLRHRHESLAFFNPKAGFSVYQERLAAFSAATEAAGVPCKVFSSSGTDDPDQEAERLVEQWMAASAPRPSGIFVPVDRVTLFVHRYLERHGITVGKDVEIISCD